MASAKLMSIHPTTIMSMASSPSSSSMAFSSSPSSSSSSSNLSSPGFYGGNSLIMPFSCINPSNSMSRGGAGAGARIAVVCMATPEQTPIIIGLAADSGCGKSTFMRRLTSVFGGAASPPKGGNPDSNTLISDTTTVICLDDYHSLDRTGRKEKGVTALDPRANDFDLMYEQVKAIKEGRAIEKPIYNHVTGLLDPPETILPPKIFVIEGLHPM